MPSNRLWIVTALVLVFGSMCLLVAASICRCSLPRWVGGADVSMAFAIVAVAGVLWTKGHRLVEASAFRLAHDVATAVVPAACLVVWIGRDSVDWNIFLPGVAWRSSIVLHS